VSRNLVRGDVVIVPQQIFIDFKTHDVVIVAESLVVCVATDGCIFLRLSPGPISYTDDEREQLLHLAHMARETKESLPRRRSLVERRRESASKTLPRSKRIHRN
jgi:hypothetical protein